MCCAGTLVGRHADKELLSAKELAERWKCDRSTVHRVLKRAGVRAYRLGGVTRYAKDDIDAFMERHSATPRIKPASRR